jgi:hypothetical protein
MSPKYRRVTPDAPCPACGKPDWCAWTQDGWLLCERSTEPPSDMTRVKFRRGGAIFCPRKKVLANCTSPTRSRVPKEKSKPKPRKHVAAYDYHNADGELLYQVVRFDPKDFLQRRPAPEGRWIWNLHGIDRVLYRLATLVAADPTEPVFVVEGEKDADRLAELGLVATCNSGGAGKWRQSDDSALTDRNVFVIADKDKPGRNHAVNVADSSMARASSVRILELPGEHVKDVSDWIDAGGTKDELLRLSQNAPLFERQESRQDHDTLDTGESEGGISKPDVILPGNGQTISDSAAELGRLLAETGDYFVRGETVVRVTTDHEDNNRILSVVRPAHLASAFEGVCNLVSRKDDGTIQKICSEHQAKLIMHSDPFLRELPHIRLLVRCPVLIERESKCVQITSHDLESGILAGDMPAADVPLDEAKKLLNSLVDGFKFSTPNDRSRALADFISPALVFGGILKCRIPLMLTEADQSQAGKGFRNKLIAAIYMEKVTTVTQRKGGVGSLEESFNSAIVRGAPFVSIDNIRGKIDSPAIESFLTEDYYEARVPYLPSVRVDPRRTIVMLTSNQADITQDLANRSSTVRIRKQPLGHKYRQFPEGDLLDHIRANQPRYLGAVFAVAEEWMRQGKHANPIDSHDFRAWAGALDWIVTNILSEESLLEGHREAQHRMTNPQLNWLRDLACLVARSGRLGESFMTNALLELMMSDGTIEIPGLSETDDAEPEASRDKARKAIGRRLGRCFQTDDSVTVDDFQVDRQVTQDDKYHKRKSYRFLSPACTPHDPHIQPRIDSRKPRIPHDDSDNSVKVVESEHLCKGLPNHAGDAGKCGDDAGDLHSNAGETPRLCGGPATDPRDSDSTTHDDPSRAGKPRNKNCGNLDRDEDDYKDGLGAFRR